MTWLDRLLFWIAVVAALLLVLLTLAIVGVVALFVLAGGPS